MRVALLCTGRCELTALPETLGALFPRHQFEAIPRRVERDGEAIPHDGFTSARLEPRSLGSASNLWRLLAEAAGRARGDPRDKAFDLVVIVDDLELFNADQPEVAVEAVRLTVRDYVAAHPVAGDLFRERVSLHFAVPMIEAWFFSDPASLAHAEVPSSPPLAHPDPECFETSDASYLAPDVCAASAPWSIAENATAPRFRAAHHPKKYLQWLCRTGDPPCETSFRETSHGCAALSALQLPVALSAPATMTWLRALIRDLEWTLDDSSVPPGGVEAPLLSLAGRPRGHVLRNL